MKTLISVLFLTLLVLPACRRHASVSVDKPILPEPTAESLQKCPMGHTTLKEVPISYGLPPFQGEAAEEWNKGVENLEFVPGGCCVMDDSPTREVICTTCRFVHSISSTRNPEDGYWIRTSTDVDSFPKPIPELIKDFPVPSKKNLKEAVAFTQSLDDNFEVQYHSVSYDTTRAAEDITSEIDQWLSSHEIMCEFTSKTHTSTLDDAVRDILNWETDRLHLSIRMHREHSDDSSSIYATFWNRP